MNHFHFLGKSSLKIVGGFVVCLLITGWSMTSLSAQEAPLPSSTDQDDQDSSNASQVGIFDVAPINFPIAIGEKLTFHVSFGLIPAGKATLEVVDTATVDGELTYHVVTAARSAKAFDYVFKVRDSIETWMDADSIYSHRFHKRLSEGRYKDDQLVVYDRSNNMAYRWDRGKKRDPQSVPARIQDVLTAGFKIRTMHFEVGDTLKVPLHDVDKTYELWVPIQARETVETLSGNYDCYRIEPVLKSGGLFKKEKGAKINLWLTADSLHIPVLMKSKVSFGSVTASLESYDPGHKIEMTR
jgi:hypothetical protein